MSSCNHPIPSRWHLSPFWSHPILIRWQILVAPVNLAPDAKLVVLDVTQLAPSESLMASNAISVAHDVIQLAPDAISVAHNAIQLAPDTCLMEADTMPSVWHTNSSNWRLMPAWWHLMPRHLCSTQSDPTGTWCHVDGTCSFLVHLVILSSDAFCILLSDVTSICMEMNSSETRKHN